MIIAVEIQENSLKLQGPQVLTFLVIHYYFTTVLMERNTIPLHYLDQFQMKVLDLAHYHLLLQGCKMVLLME